MDNPAAKPSLWQPLFEPLFVRGGDGSNKVVLGPRKGRVCRFCDRDETATTFRGAAHVIPEAFGNRSLFSNEECDDCNQLGSKLETHLASFLAAERILSRIPAGRGNTRPKIKTASKQQAYGQPDPANNQVYIFQPNENEGIQMHDDGESLELKVAIPKHQPIKVAQSIARMGLFKIDRDCLGFEPLRDWVCGKHDIFPIPMDFVTMPRVSTNTVAINCMRFSHPDRNIIRCGFFYAASTVQIAIPLDDEPLPQGFFPMIEVEPLPQGMREHVWHLLIHNDSSVEGLEKTVNMGFESRSEAEQDQYISSE